MNEAKKFDIRATVEEFKGNVGSYVSWKPGMDISVTHIKRRDIPAFVFPGGVRPARPARPSVEERRAPDTSAASSMDAATSVDVNVVDGPGDDDTRKRKREEDDELTKLTELTKLSTPEQLRNDVPTVDPEGNNVNDQAGTSGVKNESLDQKSEDISGQLGQQVEELEELDDSFQNKYLKENDMEHSTVKEVASSVNESLEELEVSFSN